MDADDLAAALGGYKVGGWWMAHCPSHDDRAPSLSLRDAGDGHILVHCHAGCDQARVIAALKARGLWGNDAGRFKRFQPASTSFKRSVQYDSGRTENVGRTAAALAIWNASRLAAGSPVEAYLLSRGLALPLPDTLRFHPGLRHSAGGVWPGMVALVTQGVDGIPIGIHRTFLAADGSTKAPLVPQRMMLGPCRGGAVRLADARPDDTAIMVGEGIETCLAAMQATRKPAWAALSTSGLRVLDLPASLIEVIILADGDDPGEAAARDAARRWVREGRSVRIARPPRGQDFNDMLVGPPSIGEGAL